MGEIEVEEQRELLLEIADTLDEIAETVKWMYTLQLASIIGAICLGVIVLFVYLSLF